MHVPDGFLDAPTSVAAGALALAGVAVSLRGARRELEEAAAPMAGLVAAFVFAAQMLNFPVVAGTSGHLLGGALAAILVGPYTAVLCLSVVLLVQGLVFADGGLSALGINVTTMGFVGVGTAWIVFVALRRLLPRSRSGVMVASGVAAFVSVLAAALAFTGFYAVGGTSNVAIGRVLTLMMSYHVLIGIGEALITAATVGSVLRTRPDLVYGARHLRRGLVLSPASIAPVVGASLPLHTPQDPLNVVDVSGAPHTGTPANPEVTR